MKSRREIIWVENSREFVKLNYEEICKCIKYHSHEWDDGKVHRNPWNKLEHLNYVLAYLAMHSLKHDSSKDGRCITYPYKSSEDETLRGIAHWYPSKYLFQTIKHITMKYVNECVYEKVYDRSEHIKGLIPKEYYVNRVNNMKDNHFPNSWVDSLKEHLQNFSGNTWVTVALKFIDMTVEGCNKSEIAKACQVSDAYITQIMYKIRTAFPSFEKLSLAEGV